MNGIALPTGGEISFAHRGDRHRDADTETPTGPRHVADGGTLFPFPAEAGHVRHWFRLQRIEFVTHEYFPNSRRYQGVKTLALATVAAHFHPISIHGRAKIAVTALGLRRDPDD
jgi:hypothetical protein